MPKLNKLAILISLLFGLNVAEAGYQFRLFTPGTIAPTCSDPWGGSLNIGQSITAYRVGAVDYGQSCQSESRSCQNGVLTGSYTFQTCAVQTAQDCNLQGYVVTHDHGVFAYSAPTVAYNSSCDTVKETRTCTNGNLSGSFTNTTCSVTPELSCTFNGAPVTSEAPVAAYSSSTVPFGTSCDSVRELRSCTNGVLSGSYTHATCNVASGCPVGGALTYSTPGTYTFVLPTGCAVANLTAKVWGAAGSSSISGWILPLGWGGAGGYAVSTTTSQITTASTITVHVGAGGKFSGMGGGASAVLVNGVELAVAGGGGGGSSYNTSQKVDGGAGGTALRPGGNGHNGGNGNYYMSGSRIVNISVGPGSVYGGTSGYGSAGSTGVRDVRNTSNNSTTGFNPGSGGGGYVGGSSGDTYPLGATGGSSYALNGTTIAGSGPGPWATPGNSADVDRVNYAGEVRSSGQGDNGQVTLRWSGD